MSHDFHFLIFCAYSESTDGAYKSFKLKIELINYSQYIDTAPNQQKVS